MASVLYKTLVGVGDKVVPSALRPMWVHPAGPKTIFFWAPACKWALVGASLKDINRPVEKMSVGQCGSLAATGVIWARYSLVIIPKNMSLFLVNVFVGIVNLYQMSRVIRYQQQQKALKGNE